MSYFCFGCLVAWFVGVELFISSKHKVGRTIEQVFLPRFEVNLDNDSE